MVKKAPVFHWSIPEISIITADSDEENAKKIFSKICKELYVDSEEGKTVLEKFTGNIKKVAVRILSQRGKEKAEIPQLTEKLRNWHPKIKPSAVKVF